MCRMCCTCAVKPLFEVHLSQIGMPGFEFSCCACYPGALDAHSGRWQVMETQMGSSSWLLEAFGE